MTGATADEPLARSVDRRPRGAGSASRAAWRRLRARPADLVGLAVLVLVVMAVALAPWIASAGPADPDFRARFAPPGAAHWFGTDDLGRDVFSRVLHGGRATLLVAAGATALATLGGTMVGVLAAFSRGVLDNLLMRVVDVWLAFPAFLLLLAIVAAFGPGTGTLILAIGVASIPPFARAVRGAAVTVRELDYVTAALLSGTRAWRIMAGHIVPNIAGVVVVYAALGFGAVVVTTSGLSFLGLGVPPPAPEWGAMLAVGNDYLRDAWWMSVFPGLAIFLTVLAVNLVGAGLRDAFDVKAVGPR